MRCVQSRPCKGRWQNLRFCRRGSSTASARGRRVTPLSAVPTSPLTGETHFAYPVRGGGAKRRRGFAVGYPPVTCGDIPPFRGDSFCLPCKGRWGSYADPEGFLHSTRKRPPGHCEPVLTLGWQSASLCGAAASFPCNCGVPPHQSLPCVKGGGVRKDTGGIVPGIDLICKAGDYSGIIQPLYSGERPSGMPSFFS